MLPKEIENIIYEYKRQLDYNSVLEEFKKKICIKVFFREGIGKEIERYYKVRIIYDNEYYDKWGFFQLEDNLYSCNITESFKYEDNILLKIFHKHFGYKIDEIHN